MIASAVAIVFAPRAAIRGGTQSLAARRRSCSSVRLPGVGVFALVGSGCAVRSRRLARVRASGVSASLRDEAVAGVVIVVPSTQQPCGYSPSVKCYGGATRRRWRRSPRQKHHQSESAAMPAFPTNSLVIWPRACWSEGCFFGHWRSGTTFSLVTGGATRRAVRKHRAPKGALRRHRLSGNNQRHHVRKHRAPKGALRRVSVSESTFSSFCQKAPSAKRCIKTAGLDQSRQRWDSVQKAPSAKRCIKRLFRVGCGWRHLGLLR